MRCRIALFSPDTRLLKKFIDTVDVVWIPLLKLKPVEGSTIKAIEALKKCPTAVFVSPRTIEILIKDAENLGLKEMLVHLLKNSVIAVIGRETEESILTHLGIKPHIVSPKPYTKDLLHYLRSKGINCITFLKAEVGDTDVDNLEGLLINVVYVYRYEIIEENIDVVKRLVEDVDVDALVVTSYTIAKVLCKNIGGFSGIPIVALGETTAKGLAILCSGENKVIVGDGTVETLKNILTQICSSSISLSS